MQRQHIVTDQDTLNLGLAFQAAHERAQTLAAELRKLDTRAAFTQRPADKEAAARAQAELDHARADEERLERKLCEMGVW